jgi:cell division protein FtsI (penicillin-binding protein 3)
MNGAQYGGDVAAPVFRELADKAYARDLAIHQTMENRVTPDNTRIPMIRAGQQEDLAMICNRLKISKHSQEMNEEWVKAVPQNQSYQFNPNPVLKGAVPDVAGMTLRDALYVLENQGLKVRAIGNGRVQKQSMQPGAPVYKGNVITIILS